MPEMPESVASDDYQSQIWASVTASGRFSDEDVPNLALLCYWHAVAKAADVTIVALDKNKPANGDAAEVPLLMTIKFEGDVAAVEAGMQAGVALAESRGLLVTSHMISRQEADTEKMARINALGKDKLNTAYLEEY